MTYIFGDDGIFSGYYNDEDTRVFILQDLNQSLDESEVAKAVGGVCPTRIAGFQVLLYMKEPILRDLAATVHGESGHNRSESEEIMRVMRNRAEHVGVDYSSINFWLDHRQGGIGGGGIYARAHRNAGYNNAISKKIENWSNIMLSNLESTVRGLVNPSDVTRGAFFWENTADLRKPTHRWRKHLDGRPPCWVVKIVLGNSSFIAYNPNGPPRCRNRVWP